MASVLHFLRPKFVAALARGILHKVRWGTRLVFPLTRTYFGARVVVGISQGGRVAVARGKRVYVSRDCELAAIGGVIEIGAGVFMNRGCSVVSMSKITIGPDTMLGQNVGIFDADHSFARGDVPYQEQPYTLAPVLIGRNVWLGANTVITRGAHIGDDTVVAANSVVRGQLEPGCLYAGAPAVLKRRLDLQPRPLVG